MVSHPKKFIFLCALFFIFNQRADARTLVQAWADPTRSRNGENILFKIRVEIDNDDKVSEPRLPVLTDWEVINAYSSSFPSVSIVNGDVRYSFRGEYTYILKPLRKGDLVIPEIPLKIGARNYNTAPIRITVDQLPGGASQRARIRPPQPLEDEDQIPQPFIPPPNPFADQLQPGEANSRESFFVRADASATTVYEGQLIVLSYSLFNQDANFANPEIRKFPDFNGFLKEELFISKHFANQPVMIQGRPYRKSELIRYAVFPLKSGNLKIDPLQFRADVVGNPMDLLQGMMNGQMPNSGFDPIPMIKESQALSIQVKPLPPAPANAKFTGGVGQFEMSLAQTPEKVQVDQPFNLTIHIRGKGNIKAIREPPLTLPKAIEPFQTKANYEFKQDATGSKTFEYLLLPRAAGPITIEPITWTYFDPDKAEYVTLNTGEIRLLAEGTPTTNPDKKNLPAVAKFSEPSTGKQTWVSTKSLQEPGPLSSRWLWSLQAALYAFFGFIIYRRQKDQDLSAYFMQFPWHRTEKEIKNTSAQSNPIEFALLVDQWTRERINGHAAKLGREGQIKAESTRDEMLDFLLQQLPEEKHKAALGMKQIWSELDLVRFAGKTSKEKPKIPAEVFQRVKTILESLLN